MSDTVSLPPGRLLYLGNVNTWECDEMGHMNVRFYAVKAQEALRILARDAGLGPHVLDENNLVLTVKDDHIRFLRELHAGSGVRTYGGIVDAGPDWFRAYIELRHSVTGVVSATVNTLAQLTHQETGTRVPLPESFQGRSPELRVEVPDYGSPRTLNLDPPSGRANLTQADQYGLHTIYRGVVQPDQCDRRGLMTPPHFIGRVSDGIVNLFIHLSEDGKGRRVPGKVGGAVVEYRLHYHALPREGAILVTRSGLKDIGSRTFHFTHWVLDEQTGAPLCTSEAVAVNFDLETRRALAITDEDREFLLGMANPDLSL